MDDAPQQTQQQPEKENKPWLFKPGESGNPGGRPKGSRNKLQGDFFAALANDFHEHGKGAIIKVREDDPGIYLRVVASLMPKEFEITRPLDEFTDDELRAAVATLRAIGNAQSFGSGATDSSLAKPAEGLQALPEAG